MGFPAPLKSNLAADSWHFSPNTVHLPLLLILIENEFELQVDIRQRDQPGAGAAGRGMGSPGSSPLCPLPSLRVVFSPENPVGNADHGMLRMRAGEGWGWGRG